MNTESEFSNEIFIDYLKKLDVNNQKRMLFMIEAELTMFDDPDYNTNFGVYPNYQHIAFDKIVRNDYYKKYNSLYAHLCDGNFLIAPNDMIREKWKGLKMQFLEELNLKSSIFGNEFEMFKFGLKLKELRLRKGYPKVKLSQESGLSVRKITQLEDFGFISKVRDISQYVLDGLKMNLNLNLAPQILKAIK